jgi:gamma-glutamylcyclotransferase (GGCT)/AIG2-like uncharacterized protein YtfP
VSEGTSTNNDELGAVFVYGTLLPGEELWTVLAPFAHEVCEAVAHGRLFDTGLGYPGAVFEESPSIVPGARVTVDRDQWPDLIEMLDEIEDEGRLFHRRPVQTSAGPAMSYEWMGETQILRLLPNGWRSR